MEKAAWIETGGIAQTETLMSAFERELETPIDKASAVVLAIAGPVEECAKGNLSNGSLELDFAPSIQRRNAFSWLMTLWPRPTPY